MPITPETESELPAPKTARVSHIFDIARSRGWSSRTVLSILLESVPDDLLESFEKRVVELAEFEVTSVANRSVELKRERRIAQAESTFDADHLPLP